MIDRGGDAGAHRDDARGEVRVGGQAAVELTDGEDARIVGRGVEQGLAVPTVGAQHVIGQQQTARPQDARARASQSALYPPSVPNSTTRRAPTARHKSWKSCPTSGEISQPSGIPNSAAARRSA